MKAYSNRFSSMEEVSPGKWIVISEVSGLPVYEDDSADFPQEKIFPGYQAARTAMVEMTEHYKTVSRGRHDSH